MEEDVELYLRKEREGTDEHLLNTYRALATYKTYL